MRYHDFLQARMIPPQIAPLVEKAAQTNVPCLILGEQGVGKEWVGKAIYQLGEGATQRYIKIDCRMLKEGTLSSHLSRLFREIRQEALSATVFLKEVGALSHGDQLRLLEVLEEGLFRTSTEHRPLKNLRWLSSSSDNLREKITQGIFAGDLYDRLQTITISIPPLRDRNKDIPVIARYLLADYAARMNQQTKGISQNVLSLLQTYWWPGNLKELEMVVLRSAIFSEGENLMEKDLFFHAEDERNGFSTFLKRTEAEAVSESNGNAPHRDQQMLHWVFFLAELVHRIKNPLVSIKTFTQLLREKFNDGEYRESFYKVVTEDIDKIDGVLTGLSNYIKLNTPLNKSDTVHQILEEVLQRNDGLLAARKIKVFKKFEKNLPETMMHDEQLKYVFQSLLQYVLPSIPPHGSIGLLTRADPLAREKIEGGALSEKKEECIEIQMIFTGLKRPMDTAETVLGISSVRPEETFDLELRLVYEILKKNRGQLTFEVNEKKTSTVISIRIPIERRKVVYYPSGRL